jgi:transposase InsO family protein
VVSASAKRQVVDHLVEAHEFSQRRACHTSGIARSTVRYPMRGRSEEIKMRATVRDYAQHYPQHGYRHITALMQRDGHPVNHKRIERLWRQEGLQLPRRKTVKRRYGEKGEIKRRTEYPNQVWSCDFTEGRTERGQKVRVLTVLDEYTRECLMTLAARSIPSARVLDVLKWLFATRGVPQHLRSDNGSEFIANQVKAWLHTSGCQTLYIEPGHPWENPFIERFIGTLKRECLDHYLFDTVAEAQHLIEQWREEYNRHRPHSSLDYLTPVEYARQHQPDVISLTPTGT